MEKFGCFHFGGDGYSQKQSNYVCKHVLRRVRKRVEYAALTDKVAEHEKTNQRQRIGSKQRDNHRDDDGEEDFRKFGNLFPRISHFYLSFLFGGAHSDNGRLHDGNQSHVGICRYHDCRHIIGFQHAGDINGGRTVCRSDDCNGRRVFKLETEQACGKQRKKDSELRRRAEKHKLWICQQRFKINHCTDSDKQ